MNEITELLTSLGNNGIELLVIPVIIWTCISLAVMAFFKLSDNIHPAYQYHGRIAILCSLPLGVLASYIISLDLFSPSENQEALSKFIIFQNPLSITPGSAAEQANFTDPAFITGLVMIIAGIIMIGCFIKIGMDIWSLSRFSGKLNYHSYHRLPSISDSNKAIIHKSRTLRIAFSGQVEVPFTFGWSRKVIVLPHYLYDKPEKMNMALRHELMHIKHGDYLLNIVLMGIKATFWLHPLVHKFYTDFKDYRELVCDSQVLADKSIPQKRYAELLFELAPKKAFAGNPSVSMSVQSSTLKKRIQTMKTQDPQKTSTFTSSLYLMFISLFLITGIIACTDIQDGGITNAEIQETQKKITVSSKDKQPIYVINGELSSEINKNIVTKLKPKHIKSIEVLKTEEAVKKYGPKGKNGVVNITLYDTKAALNDLNETAPKEISTSDTSGDVYKVVEIMPKLSGGLQSLTECVEYPKEAANKGIEGRVVVSFIVNKKGKVENPEVLTGIDELNKEALRCVRNQTFEPGMHKGKPVKVQFGLPINFKL